jgi:hypothetical protein
METKKVLSFEEEKQVSGGYGAAQSSAGIIIVIDVSEDGKAKLPRLGSLG